MKTINRPLRTIVHSKDELVFQITPKHVQRAKCGKPGECVIAQALEDLYQSDFIAFEVGSNVTKIYSRLTVVCYHTPYNLANALKTFDKTKQWHLPPGEYTLLPYKKRPRRWEKAKRQGGTQSVFRGRISAPTRRTMKACQLMAA